MSHTTVKDKAGHDLKPGDLIVYGHALGRCAALRYGMIISINKPKEDSYSNKDKLHVRVRGVDDGWDGKPELLSKDSTLQFGDRILRISNSQMPEKVLKLLRDHDYEQRGLK